MNVTEQEREHLLTRSHRSRRLMVTVAVTSGTMFIIAAFIISVYALSGVKQQQVFLCGLIGQSVVQQQAQLTARARNADLFARYDASPQIRAKYAKEATLYKAQALNFASTTSHISSILGGRCQNEIDKARRQLAKSEKQK